MKKKFLLLIGIFHLGITYAQVGINTDTPEAMLHIKSGESTATTNALNIVNSDNTGIFTVRNDGYIITSGVHNAVSPLDLRDGIDNSIIGIGQSSQTAATANEGAIKYETKLLYCSDGTDWHQLASNPIKAYVIADVLNPVQQFSHNVESEISDWNLTTDLTNSFNTTTGEFTAPRSGIYTFSLVLTLSDDKITQFSSFNVYWRMFSSVIKCTSSFNTTSTKSLPVSVLCTGSFAMNTNEVLKASVLQTFGGNRSLKSGGYNNLTIIEN
ncbi:hypothetical protein [Dysgonomonas macrotermitis]|nr:hypothetical protein [Dysgonomonas macrotermitis]